MPALFLHNSQTRKRELFAPADPGHVRMYVCGPTVYDLPHLGNVRSTVVFDVVARLLRALYPPRHLRPKHYRRGRQDLRTRRRRRRDHRRADRPHHSRLPRRHGGHRQRTTRRRAARHRPRAGNDRRHRETDRRRPRLRRGRPRAVRGGQLRAVRRTVRPQPGRPDRRRPRGRGPLQARPRRLRAVEAQHAGPARLGQPVGPRAPGLAHRVQCHGLALPRRGVRHPRRRHRPAVPAPRERTRAKPVRLSRCAFRPRVAAQRHAAGGRREDVEKPRQLRHPARRAGPRARPRRCAC